MNVTRITLENYRSYPALTVELAPGLNVLTGENAQGKTNLLEAVYLSSIGRSMRTTHDRDLIAWGETKAHVRTEVAGAGGRSRVDIILDKTEKKKIAVNGSKISKLGELMGVVATVLFSPDEISIVKSGPSDRRRFMDVTICQISRAYFYILQRYNKVLRQRNNLLKSGVDSDTLDIWDAQLVSYGAKIIKTRRGFIERLNRYVGEEHAYLTSGKERVFVAYESLEGGDEKEIAAAFSEELARTRERDLAQGFTHAGAQTDDFVAMLGNVDLRKFGSQGQQRTAALSLKLASLELFREVLGEYPVLLLDDVFSELDDERQKKLAARLPGHQTVITATHIEPALMPAFEGAAFYDVRKGSVTPRP